MLSLLVAVPLAAALTVFFLPRAGEAALRRFSIAAGTAEVFLSLMLAGHFSTMQPGFQFAADYPWIPSWGVSLRLGVDGLSVALIILTAFLTLLVLCASTSVKDRSRAYLGCMLLLEGSIIGVLTSLDMVCFYVFWEAMLIPMYLLIGIWGGERRIHAALKFVLFTSIGSLLMLVAIVYLGLEHEAQYGRLSFSLLDWGALRLSGRQELLLFCAFALAFAIKIPVIPLHTWLPDAHVEAPTGGSVILAGVLLKMGLYGLIRFCIPVFPAAVAAAAPLFAALGAAGIIYGALVAWVQEDFKKLVAYSSVSHLGFCVLGFGAMNLWGLQGAMLQMLNHGLSTGALFFIVGVLYERRHSRRIADYGGLAAKMPFFSAVFFAVLLSSIGLPLTNGFIGEFLILFGGFRFSPLLGAAGAAGVVLGAVYMLSVYRRLIFGEAPARLEAGDLTLREKLIFAPLLAAILAIGVYPQPVLNLLRGSAQESLSMLRGKETADSAAWNLSLQAADGHAVQNVEQRQ